MLSHHKRSPHSLSFSLITHSIWIQVDSSPLSLRSFLPSLFLSPFWLSSPFHVITSLQWISIPLFHWPISFLSLITFFPASSLSFFSFSFVFQSHNILFFPFPFIWTLESDLFIPFTPPPPPSSPLLPPYFFFSSLQMVDKLPPELLSFLLSKLDRLSILNASLTSSKFR